MQNLNELAIVLLAIASVSLIGHGFSSIFLLFKYLSLKKSLETLSNLDYVNEIAKIAGIATRADRRTDALNESMEALNAKSAQRWRREDAREKKEAKERLGELVAAEGSESCWPGLPAAQTQRPTKPRLVRRVG